MTISREDYASRRDGWDRELFKLTRRLRAGSVPVVVVFEGAQGAGMGRAIFELTERMDPRIYTVHAVGPPRGFERSRPWLWRFWMALPARGSFAIFDESWYLRVLGDRANRTVRKKEWRAAFEEIAAFERQLQDDGAVLIKIFFEIDKKTARRRLRRAERAGAPRIKRWRRNFARFDAWREAADEMLERTSVERSPWRVIPANDERSARAQMFEVVIDALGRALDERTVPQPLVAHATPPPPLDGAASGAPLSAERR
jgi:polyphosphate kinase 2 (PPK2 family)